MLQGYGLRGGLLYAETEKGERAVYDLKKFKGFRNASPEQLRHFTIIGGCDLHWPDLDEDINLEGMLYDNGLCQLTKTEDSVVYRPVSESNDWKANLSCKYAED